VDRRAFSHYLQILGRIMIDIFLFLKKFFQRIPLNNENFLLFVFNILSDLFFFSLSISKSQQVMVLEAFQKLRLYTLLDDISLVYNFLTHHLTLGLTGQIALNCLILRRDSFGIEFIFLKCGLSHYNF
jgi:hypothetical protein